MEVHGEGFRVYLSQLAFTDADALAREADSPEIADSIAAEGEFPSPYTRENAIAFIGFATSALADMSEVHMGMRLEDGKALIGAVGLKNVDLKNMRAEIGFWCGRGHWGNGYTKEGVRLMLHVAFRVMELNRVYATAFTTNERSIRMMKGVGMTEEGTLREDTRSAGGFKSSVLLSVLKGEYAEPARMTTDGMPAPTDAFK